MRPKAGATGATGGRYGRSHPGLAPVHGVDVLAGVEPVVPRLRTVAKGPRSVPRRPEPPVTGARPPAAASPRPPAHLVVHEVAAVGGGGVHLDLEVHQLPLGGRLLALQVPLLEVRPRGRLHEGPGLGRYILLLRLE